jgi:hypothetical protein
LRWDAQNVFNHPNWSGLSTVVNSTSFGRVTGAQAMRQMSFQARVSF